MAIASKVALAMASSAVGAAMLAGGSFALFTSSATNTDNTFAAGTVNVDASNGNQPAFTSTSYNFQNMAPGDSGIVNLTVHNTGSLSEWVVIPSTGIVTTGGIFDATTTDMNGITNTAANDQPLVLTPNANMTAGDTGYLLAPGSSTTIAINYSLPLAANNFYQGQTGSATITVEAIQARNNSIDSSKNPVSYPYTGAVGPQSWS
ncbi:TasA family protein [Ferroacidibacillus organovorans]|uniref:Camelysin metallo-endopeptidase n=1 Tax=Ferroacidibacillus organovorans TaxID=1765683 RepID=A0A162U2W9_9BACL|nr:TasA family protein [Ferroacidibacillus organovorans]KYP81359.1 hypothetical protein AYJ22_00915 [Ferroacidibacillus organovorans]OAG95146.1 hypothetical protein AYW79_01515 [Ferroacidibacillus organovorans]OPG15136.1 hypothetical protein B2M26_13370 [Ferroacidibacillus organovorans]